MAAKVIAQFVIQTATVLSKAFFTAYQQALHSKNDSCNLDLIAVNLISWFLLGRYQQICAFLSNLIFVHFSDAKSGGAAAPNMAKVLKYKLHPDEAFQILSIDKKGLSKKILDDVR